MLRPKALDHVGLVVTDMDRTLHFYTDGLGLELLRRSERGGGVTSAVLRIGDQEINIFSGPDAAARGNSALQPIDHFCLAMEATSIDAVIEGLRQAGIDIASGPVERRDGTALFVRDPDGVRVELTVKK